MGRIAFALSYGVRAWNITSRQRLVTATSASEFVSPAGRAYLRRYTALTPSLFRIPLPIPAEPNRRQFCAPAMASAEPEDAAMRKKSVAILAALEQVYPIAPVGFLDHNDSFTLLVAVVLSAQSLDKKVNEVTKELFRVAGTPQTMRTLGAEGIRELIKQIGLAPQKAKNLERLSGMICDEYDGQVPSTFEDLERLPGVGHKTASVVMMQAFNKPAFPVDTHIHRLACRWGIGDAKSVERTEARLKVWFPDPLSWQDLHVRIILFGREHCAARRHDMDACPICKFAATDEARAANRASPGKFVAAKKHKNPFAMRPAGGTKRARADEDCSELETEDSTPEGEDGTTQAMDDDSLEEEGTRDMNGDAQELGRAGRGMRTRRGRAGGAAVAGRKEETVGKAKRAGGTKAGGTGKANGSGQAVVKAKAARKTEAGGIKSSTEATGSARTAGKRGEGRRSARLLAKRSDPDIA